MNPPVNLAKGLPALLSIHDTIHQKHTRWVAKDKTRLLEADTVLALIGEVLGLIPLEPDSAHYNSVITIQTLCKLKLLLALLLSRIDPALIVFGSPADTTESTEEDAVCILG